MTSGLTGYDHQPFFVEPTGFHVMVYPVEWITDGMFPDEEIRRILPQYYVRAWGKNIVRCFPTLFYASIFDEWFADDLATGLRECARSNSELRVFPSEGYQRLMEGKLKELANTPDVKLKGALTSHKKSIGQYFLHPLYPSELAVPRVYNIQLGIPLPPDAAVSDLRAMLN